jgi:peptidoglycan/xylan/chitin deacetylase (PgdA/CDA1 family)
MIMALTFRDISKTLFQRFYSPSRFVWRLSARQPVVALTFDDGPDPVHTPIMLDLLARHGIKATFFLIGEKAEKYPELVRRMAEEGHGIGGHTWSHREIVGQSRDMLAADLGRCRQLVRDISGVDSVLFRPPRGKVDLASIHHVCTLGYCLAHWTKTYSDYQCDGADRLIERFRKNKPVARDIVLLHDHNEHTIAALATLIPEWIKDGLVFAKMAGDAK